MQEVGWKSETQCLRVRLSATAWAAVGDGVLKEGHGLKIGYRQILKLIKVPLADFKGIRIHIHSNDVSAA